MTRNNADATDARSTQTAHEQITLLRELQEGDEVLYRAGSSKGSTNPTEPLEVVESGWQTHRQQPHHKDSKDDMLLSAFEERRVDNHRYEPQDFDTEEYDYGSEAGGRVTHLYVEYEGNEWEATLEGPRGGKYRLRESDGQVYHAPVSHSGLGGELLDLSLEARNDSEEEAQEVYDEVLGQNVTTLEGRDVVVEKGTAGRFVEADVDGDEFVLRKTNEKGDLHVDDQWQVEAGRGRSWHLVFEDDYETFVEDGVKDDHLVKAAGDKLDWSIAHQKCHPDNSFRWSFDRSALGYVAEFFGERGYTVTVEEEYAGTPEHLDVGETGLPALVDTDTGVVPADGVVTRQVEEEAEDTDDTEEAEEDTVTAEDADADDDTEEKAEQFGVDTSEDEYGRDTSPDCGDFRGDGEGGYERAFFEARAEEKGVPVEEYIEAMAEFGIYVLGGEEGEEDSETGYADVSPEDRTPEQHGEALANMDPEDRGDYLLDYVPADATETVNEAFEAYDRGEEYEPDESATGFEDVAPEDRTEKQHGEALAYMRPGDRPDYRDEYLDGTGNDYPAQTRKYYNLYKYEDEKDFGREVALNGPQGNADDAGGVRA